MTKTKKKALKLAFAAVAREAVKSYRKGLEDGHKSGWCDAMEHYEIEVPVSTTTPTH